MEEPVCKKCGGILDHRPVESDFWICAQCGYRHRYVTNPPTKAQMRVEELRSRMKVDAERLEYDLAGFTASIEAVVEAAMSELSADCTQILQAVRQSYKLLRVSRKSVEDVIEELSMMVTPRGNGHFEVYDAINYDIID